MIYRKFGKTGIKISRLGFGAMRLPEKTVRGKNVVDVEESVRIMHYAFKKGVNYLDTAWMYNNHESEAVVGKALKGWRDRIWLSTKSPGGDLKKPGDYRRILEKQLKKLDTDYIDFYHFHGIGWGSWKGTDKKTKWISAARQAKREGLIRNISFSFHSDPKDIIKLVDTGMFASMLCQYNFLDRSNEKGMAYAKKNGVGVVIMGPCGGGRLAEFPAKLRKELNLPVRNSAELAFRFVFANNSIDCVISGMGSMKMVKDNLRWASDEHPLKKSEVAGIHKLTKRLKKIADLYCTGCRYCMPCPNGIDIPWMFGQYNTYTVYGLKDHAKTNYRNIGRWPWVPKVAADTCIECGKCEPKCPQKIPIIKQLKKTHKLLARAK